MIKFILRGILKKVKYAESDMLNTVIDIDGFLPKREASGNK